MSMATLAIFAVLHCAQDPNPASHWDGCKVDSYSSYTRTATTSGKASDRTTVRRSLRNRDEDSIVVATQVGDSAEVRTSYSLKPIKENTKVVEHAEETIVVDSNSFRCRVIETIYNNGRTVTRWLSDVAPGGLVKETGSFSGATWTRRLTKVSMTFTLKSGEVVKGWSVEGKTTEVLPDGTKCVTQTEKSYALSVPGLLLRSKETTTNGSTQTDIVEELQEYKRE